MSDTLPSRAPPTSRSPPTQVVGLRLQSPIGVEVALASPRSLVFPACDPTQQNSGTTAAMASPPTIQPMMRAGVRLGTAIE